jgi:uncharacterized protein (TIGR03437 family)
VTSSGAASNAVKVPVRATAIEVFSVANSDGTPNGPNRPAAPGSVVTLYASGLGLTTPRGEDGRVNTGTGTLVMPVIASLHGQNLPIQYAGPAPGLVAGVSQINILLPGGLTGVNSIRFESIDGPDFVSVWVH